MKNGLTKIEHLIFTASLSLLFMMPYLLFGQTLPKYELNSQAEIDEFIATCGCIDDAGHLDGDLKIKDYSPDGSAITNLAPLSSIISVEGKLSIWQIKGITDLSAFQQVQSIEGALEVINTSVVNLNGLENITQLGSLDIDLNENLEDINALAQLTSIDGSCYIGKSPLLKDLNALGRLRVVGRYFHIIETGISSLAGLANLDTIGNLNILRNENLVSLDGLSTVSIRDNTIMINISNNPKLSSIAGLAAIEGPNWDFIVKIDENPLLSDLEGLEHVSYIKQLSILFNAALSNLEGLNGLTEVGERLEIANNEQLTDFTGLEQLEQVKGDFSIVGNSLLQSINLAQLHSIDSTLMVFQNAILPNFNGLEQLELIGDIFISQNPNLSDLSGLDNVQTIGASVYIISNEALETCCLVNCWYENEVVKGEYTINDNKPNSICNSLTDITNNCTMEACEEETQVGTSTANQVITPKFQIFQENNQLSILGNSTTSFTNTRVKVYHITGQLVEQQKFNTDNATIDMSHYATGTYILVVETEEERYVERFVKW